jgi:hypothetical protein
MRSVDGDNTFQPLGPPKPRPAPAAPTLTQPTGTPGIVRGPDGKLETNIPTPPPDHTPWLYIGNPTTWGTVIESLRREFNRHRL